MSPFNEDEYLDAAYEDRTHLEDWEVEYPSVDAGYHDEIDDDWDSTDLTEYPDPKE